MFHLGEAEMSEHHRILVVNLGGDEHRESVGIVVDQVREVLRTPPSANDNMPKLLTRGGGLDEITSVCLLDGGKRLVSVLSSTALFEHPAVQAAVEAGRDEAPEGTVMEPSSSHRAAQREQEETQLVVFRLAGEEYGVVIESVQEIIRVPEEMSRVPKTPAFVEGLVNLRGTILPVLDMRARFGQDPIERNDRQRILVLSLNGVQTGFIVDSVTEVLRLARSVIESSPRLSEEQARVMGRVANLRAANRMILTLNVEELLDEHEMKSLSGARI